MHRDTSEIQWEWGKNEVTLKMLLLLAMGPHDAKPPRNNSPSCLVSLINELILNIKRWNLTHYHEKGEKAWTLEYFVSSVSGGNMWAPLKIMFNMLNAVLLKEGTNQ